MKKILKIGKAADIGLLILFLLIVSSCIASGLFARYKVQGDELTAVARVSKWDVDADGDDSIVLPSGGDQNQVLSYAVTVESNSETALTYDVVVVFEEDMSQKIRTPLFNDIAPEEGDAFTNTLTFASVGALPAGEQQSEVGNFTFGVTEEYWNLINSLYIDDYQNETISGSKEEIGFTVSVRIVQCD